jgi:hypothetical protein
MIPIAVESRNAGSVVASALPMDSSANVCAADAISMRSCATPIAKPATRLTATMTSAATASPRTNFPAPSIAP